MTLPLNHSKVGMRMVLPEGPGIGAYCGNVYHWTVVKRPEECIKLSLIGNHSWIYSLLVSIASLRPIISPFFPCNRLHPTLIPIICWRMDPCTHPFRLHQRYWQCRRTSCTVPLIDAINGNTYVIAPQGGGDEDGFARGAWDWSMLWKRVPLSKREKERRKHKTEPYW